MDTETPKNYQGKPIVNICSYCQKINQPNMVSYAKDIDQTIKNEMKVVDEQVIANQDKYSFTHGICRPHTIQTLRAIPYMTTERLKSMMDKKSQNPNTPPCLLQDEPLRHAYMKGLFTKEDIETVNQSNQQITERFKTLAGIKF
jgi:hypothetical protein